MVVVISHRAKCNCTCTPYRESCPLLPLLARKEGSILGHFLINVRDHWFVLHLTLHPLARGGIDPRDRTVLSLLGSSGPVSPRRCASRSSAEKWIPSDHFWNSRISLTYSSKDTREYSLSLVNFRRNFAAKQRSCSLIFSTKSDQKNA